MGIKEEIRTEILQLATAPFIAEEEQEKVEDDFLPKFPVAKNIIEWITHPRFLDMSSIWEYPQQFEIVRDFFEIWCPSCNSPETRDCSQQDPVDLGAQILLENGKCPKCGITKLDLQTRDSIHNFNELVGAAGRRGGKSVVLGAFIATYTLHRALCIENLWQYYGLIPGQSIEMTFIAAAAQQAKDTIWQTFKNAIDHSPWFTKYIKQLKFAEKKTPGVHTEDFFRETDLRLEFKIKHLNCVALNSNSASAVGRTNLFVALDELAKFDHTSSKRSADEVYKSMKKGLKTIQSAADAKRQKGIIDPLDAIMGSISSPMWADDKIMRLVKAAEETQRIFAFHKSTYEMNPQITRESTADDYIEDPIGAMRDYDAIPPDAFNAFIPDSHVIEASYDNSLTPILTYQEHFVEENNFKYVAIKLAHCLSDKMTRRVIVCDAGRKKDSFGMSIAHLDSKTGQVVYDAIIEIRPISRNEIGSTPREVHFDSVLEFVKELNKYIFLEMIAYDRWASVSHIQTLRSLNFNVLEFNVNYEAYIRFRKALAWGKLRLLPPEKGAEKSDIRRVRGYPVAKAMYELRTLQEVMGKKVEKSSRSSDDLIQTLVGCNLLLTASPEELAELLKSSGNMKGRKLSYNSFMNQGRKPTSGRVVHFRR